jgi:hypothetical protein
VEEYERRISHLEYQLDLLKRQFGGELPALDAAALKNGPAQLDTPNLLLYDAYGRLLRRSLQPEELEHGRSLARLSGRLADGEPPRLLAATQNDELLFVFSSGRVATLAVRDIPLAASDARLGEHPGPAAQRQQLACVTITHGAGRLFHPGQPRAAPRRSVCGRVIWPPLHRTGDRQAPTSPSAWCCAVNRAGMVSGGLPSA